MHAAPAILLLLLFVPLASAQAIEIVATDDGSGGGPGYHYEPRMLTVHPGEAITLRNTGQEPHSFTPAQKGAFNDTVLQPGETATITAPATPGTYKLYCKFHASASADPATAMAGTITVFAASTPPPRAPGFTGPVALAILAIVAVAVRGRR